jgi:hypothetical protein
MADTVSSMKDAAHDVAADIAREKQAAQDVMKNTVQQVKEELIEPDTQGRVARHTPPEIEERLRRELAARVHYFAQRPEEIDRRLEELDQEWDIERLLQANAGVFSLAGLTFGVLRSRWYLLSAAVAEFLIQHAFQGWCPPASVLRRLGIRTTEEINHERYALKALRGDFESVRMEGDEDPEERARHALEAADFEL